MNKTLRAYVLAAVSVGAILAAMAAGGVLTGPARQETGQFVRRGEIGGLIRRYLIENPDVLAEASRALEEKNRREQAERAKRGIRENAAAIYHQAGDLIVGDPSSKVVLVEFFDYNCGYCKHALKDILRLQETNRDLKIIIKEFPILGAGSQEAARLALAAGRQGKDKYWRFHLAMMRHKGVVDGRVAEALARRAGLDVDKLKADAASPEIRRIIAANMNLAAALGVNGTPAFIIGDDLIPGALGYQALNAIIAKARKQGCDHC